MGLEGGGGVEPIRRGAGIVRYGYPQLDSRKDGQGARPEWVADVDAIFFCPHAADSTCDCRKPKPGLLKQIAERFNVDLTGCQAWGRSAGFAGGRGGGLRAIWCLPEGIADQDDPALPPGTRDLPTLAAVVAELTI